MCVVYTKDQTAGPATCYNVRSLSCLFFWQLARHASKCRVSWLCLGSSFDHVSGLLWEKYSKQKSGWNKNFDKIRENRPNMFIFAKRKSRKITRFFLFLRKEFIFLQKLKTFWTASRTCSSLTNIYAKTFGKINIFAKILFKICKNIML
jgi:hypothetical protein